MEAKIRIGGGKRGCIRGGEWNGTGRGYLKKCCRNVDAGRSGRVNGLSANACRWMFFLKRRGEGNFEYLEKVNKIEAWCCV